MEEKKKPGHLFKPGQSGNPGGKPKGTTHHRQRQIRQMISDFLNGHFEQIEADFMTLKPKDRVKFYIDLLQYGAPKLGAVSVSHDFKSMLTGTSDEELLILMEGMIVKRQALSNESKETIELSAKDYKVEDEGQPERQL